MGSPFRSTRHDARNLSSSPGLPSLDQLKSQLPKNPPIRNGSVAMPMSDQASQHFTGASNLLRQEPSAIDLTTPCKDPNEPPMPQQEDDVTVISIATLTSKPKRKRGVKVLEKKANEPSPNPTRDAGASPPWKKYTKPKDTVDILEKRSRTTKVKALAKKGGVKSHHFAKPKTEEEREAPPLSKKDADEPLELEAALRRRMDWTPPPADSRLATGFGPSQFIELPSSAARNPSRAASKDTFEKLLKKYGRPDEDAPKRPSAEPSDGENPAFKKRKLIETVPVSDSSKMAPPGKGVTKAKAPRKKPRTITELATAAYVVPDATGQEIASALPQESVVNEDEAAKPKGKKRASKAKKPKKLPPPEPILLSPTAALRQAADQDYIFGTSSQLAREHSPAFLRDLQSALQASNSLREEDPFVTPINSDAIEPEPKQKLWDVGARDEDGRLLDLEVINLADTPQAVPGAAAGLNPFGYAAGVENQPAPLPAHIPSDVSFPDIEDLLSKVPVGDASTEEKQAAPLSAHIPSDVSFPDIDDLLGNETGDKMPRGQKGVSPFISAARSAEPESGIPSPVLISSGSVPNVETVPELPSASETEVPKSTAAVMPTPGITKPDFDLYTDNQLAGEIAFYGFKPVKRRQAMLALLDQCWTSKQRTALASLPTNHPISTSSQAQTVASKPPKLAANTSPKRPRGLPRKNSEIEMPSSEPPPSAQPPPPSPKRGRGRPKKNAEPVNTTSTSATARKGKAKASIAAQVVPKVASLAASPRSKKAKASVVIEIPDSASDGSLSPSPSACSSPEPTFSPPPEDVSVSIGDDTEMSLAASPTSQSSVLFAQITEAVTSAPPTTDPKKPSFHEMMLMYDPIVLEDLAIWLNTGQLSRVGYDGEVSPNEVKQWCESKSVCCLWRESLRGKERKRY
ncbi:at hook domain-containing protein [Colletotrichum incanum]|uniref:Structure-specific endonuclease subunit SLX4 n=1 Tax=Colletotrichum incanum TaxID=1573173 RepID=A0A161VX66_COLIC|nr:at hook domain-containing protein [Colletotrichum incanum]OHX00047.1 AT hook domain-containing protein [Colletotrichum incanum]